MTIGQETKVCRRIALNKRIGPSQTLGAPPVFEILITSGAMVDIGLGPTDGFKYLTVYLRSWSPRRVQTDAYHRPCVLNYVPCALTSFSVFPPSG
jgi:hypothetical protein